MLATELMRFFHSDISSGRRPEFKTLESFVDSTNGSGKSRLGELLRVCSVLAHHGELVEGSQAIVGFDPALGRTFFAPDYHAEIASYGSYDYLVEGFSLVAKDFATSVLPIIVQNEDGTDGIGTGFILDKTGTLVTAKHVIEKKSEVRILDDSGNPIQVESILVSENPNLDIAILSVAGDPFSNRKPFRYNKHEFLEEILCVGYPPIPGFHSFQAFSLGHIVGSEAAILDKQNYLLTTARVKGGNSGGPVINRRGVVVGVVTSTPIDDIDARISDSLGYSLVVPTSEFRSIGDAAHNMNFQNLERGGFSTG